MTQIGQKMAIWRENGDLSGKWHIWRAWWVAFNESFLLMFESLKSARKWRFGGKMAFWWEIAYLAGKWRAWRVALNESFLLIFESLKSAGKW